jgi:hypothetical protein
MPLQDALPVLAAALRPGGVLAAIALPRPDVRRELPAEIVAAAAHRLLGAMFLMKGLRSLRRHALPPELAWPSTLGLWAVAR